MTREDVIKTREWSELFTSLPVLQKFFEGDPHAHGFHALLHSLAVYLEKMLDHMDNNKPFIWHNLGFNPELTYALEGAYPVAIECAGVLHNLLGDINISLDFIDSAQSAGIPADCCSADKIAIGAIQKGLYPPPACTVGINTPCDAQVLSTQVMQELSGAPFFAIDVPYYHNEETIRHVAAQLKELIPFMEEHTGCKLDYDRLREVCELSNQTTEALWEWLEWRKHTPLTQSSKMVAFTLMVQV